MANVKITQLPLATTPLTGTEVFPLVQGTTTKQVAITGLFTSPVMTNPTLGTVGQADLINATGLPISTGVAGLGTGIATFLGTPSSANLRAAVTDETGTGSLVFATSPTLVTPNLGTPTFLVATNATGTALGLIAGSAITNANLTGAVTSVGNATSLGSFTSAQLRTALTDETGSGVAVFATSPTLVTPVLGTPQSGDFSTGTFTWPTFNQNTSGTAAGLSATLAIASGGTAATTAASAIENLLPAYAGNGSKGLRLNSGATALEWVADGGGTVTSVAATVPSFLSIAGSPITTSGTLAFSLSGTALPTTSGGTGLTSFTSGGVVYASSTSALATGSALTFDGTSLLLLNAGNASFGEISGSAMTLRRTTSGNNIDLNFYNPISTAGVVTRIRTDGDGVTNAWGALSFQTTQTPDTLVERYRIKADGTSIWSPSGTEALRLTSTSLYTASGINVGIGTSSPSTKLEVAGNIKLTDTSPDLFFNVSGGANYSFMLAAQENVSNTFEITPSTTAGGSTFTSPVYSVSYAGLHKWFNGSTQAMTLDASSRLSVGTTSTLGQLTVSAGSNRNGLWVENDTYDYQTLSLYNKADANDNIFARFFTESASPNARGSITYNRTGGLVAYNTTSDYRAKDISGPVTDSGSLIDSVPVYMGKMKDATQERPMFLAHETPAYAHTGEKDAVDADGKPVYQQMDASALIPVMWAEIQSLRQRVAQLER